MKKKRIIAIAVTVLVLATTVFMVGKVISKTELKKKAALKTVSLPDFSFQTLRGGIYTKDSIEGNKYCVFIHFSPGCDHCHYEAREIKKHIRGFNVAELIMVSSADSTSIAAFAAQYGLNDQPNIHFALDQSGLFYKTFGTSSVPAVFIYDRRHRLLEKIIGEVKIEAVTKHFTPG